MSQIWPFTRARADLSQSISDMCWATLKGLEMFLFMIMTAPSGVPTYFTSIFSSLGILFNCFFFSSSNSLLRFSLI